MKNISKNIEKIIDYLTEQLPAQNILNDPESLKKYSIDKTSNLSARPHLVVKIESAAQAALILKIANQYKVPVIPRGSGTGVTGGSLAIKGGIILSLEKMNNIIEIV